VQECKGPQPAVARLSKRLFKLAGDEGLTTAMSVIQHLTDSNDGELSQSQLDALADMKRIFHVS